jgi:hypothetical protein
MIQARSVEERLDTLERAMADLKRRVDERETKKNWIEKITGTFENDPDFAEILRLGQEIRRADRFDSEVEG